MPGLLRNLILLKSSPLFHNIDLIQVVDPDGTIRELTSGDAFGVRLPPPPSADGAMSGSALVVQRHRGQMHTVTEDCQFVCVAQADYFRIMAQAADAEVPEVEEDGGRVVLVYEDIRKGTAPTSADADAAPLAPSSSSSALVSRVVIKARCLHYLLLIAIFELSEELSDQQIHFHSTSIFM